MEAVISSKFSRRSFLASTAATILSRSAAASAQSIPLISTAEFKLPAWIEADLKRNAKWLPDDIKSVGFPAVYQARMRSFLGRPEILRNLRDMNIPPWMIALIPTTRSPKDQYDILQQLAGMHDLEGEEPSNKYAKRLEKLAIFAGAAYLPTPGDIRGSGASLDDEGCSAFVSRYLLAQLVEEYPELTKTPRGMKHPELTETRLTNSQDSSDQKNLFQELTSEGYFHDEIVPFRQLGQHPEKFTPGQIIIAHKPGGTHVMVVTRVPRYWKWLASNLMLIGNTGLKKYGAPHASLAQDTTGPGKHGDHGAFYSHQWADGCDRSHGRLPTDTDAYLIDQLGKSETNVFGALDDNIHISIHKYQGEVKVHMISILDPDQREPENRMVGAPVDAPTPPPPSCHQMPVSQFADVPLPKMATWPAPQRKTGDLANQLRNRLKRFGSN